jgi:hypothetical protein
LNARGPSVSTRLASVIVAKGKPSRYADSVIDAFNADVAKFREQIEADERAEAQQAELDRANWSDDDDMFSMLLK